MSMIPERDWDEIVVGGDSPFLYRGIPATVIAILPDENRLPIAFRLRLKNESTVEVFKDEDGVFPDMSYIEADA